MAYWQAQVQRHREADQVGGKPHAQQVQLVLGEVGSVLGSRLSIPSVIAVAGASTSITTAGPPVIGVVGSIAVVSSGISRKNFNKRFRRNAVDIHAK